MISIHLKKIKKTGKLKCNVKPNFVIFILFKSLKNGENIETNTRCKGIKIFKQTDQNYFQAKNQTNTLPRIKKRKQRGNKWRENVSIFKKYNRNNLNLLAFRRKEVMHKLRELTSEFNFGISRKLLEHPSTLDQKIKHHTLKLSSHKNKHISGPPLNDTNFKIESYDLKLNARAKVKHSTISQNTSKSTSNSTFLE